MKNIVAIISIVSFVFIAVFLVLFISKSDKKNDKKFVKILKEQRTRGDYIKILEIDGCEYISNIRVLIHKENCKNCKGKNYENNEKRTTFDFFN